jgi:hypothetical protein
MNLFMAHLLLFKQTAASCCGVALEMWPPMTFEYDVNQKKSVHAP